MSEITEEEYRELTESWTWPPTDIWALVDKARQERDLSLLALAKIAACKGCPMCAEQAKAAIESATKP